MPAPRLIVVGGNSEASIAEEPSLRKMSNGANGGALAQELFKGFFTSASPTIACDYFSWTGDGREDEWWLPIAPGIWDGPAKIVKALGARTDGAPLVVIGWSNGGDTAFKTAAMLNRRVDALITLDPVSRITRGELTTADDMIVKPDNVDRWFHVYAEVGLISFFGGHWGSQTNANLNFSYAGKHGHTASMIMRVVRSSEYQQFRSSIYG